MKAHAKQSARDMIGMLTGSEKIPWMAEQSSAELLEDALQTRAGKGLSHETVGASSTEGVEVLPANSYPAGIRWPRRLR
jgi:hypothetical protein